MSAVQTLNLSEEFSNEDQKNVSILFVAAVVFFSCFYHSHSHAQQQVSTTTSQVSLIDSIKERARLIYSGQMVGPGLTQLNSGFSPNAVSGSKGDPVYLFNQITGGVKLGKGYSLNAIGRFMYTPGSEPEWGVIDPRVSLSNGKLIHRGNFNVGASLMTDVPLTQASQKRSLQAAPALSVAITEEIPVAHLTVGTYGSFRTFIYSADGGGRDANLYLAPFVYYNINSKLRTTLMYELAGYHDRHEALNKLNGDGADVQAGISWDVTEAVSFNPYVQVLTGAERTTFQNASIGAYLSGVIL